jgi:hypothetical protein
MKAITHTDLRTRQTETYILISEDETRFYGEDKKGKKFGFLKENVTVVEVEGWKSKAKKALTPEQQAKADRAHDAFTRNLKNAELNENYLPSQIKSGRF